MSLTTTLAPCAASSRACSRPDAPSCPRHDCNPSLAQAAHGMLLPISTFASRAFSLFRAAISRKIGACNNVIGGPRGRGSTTTAGADAGDQAFLGRHARPASCGCSAATTAATRYFPPRPFCPNAPRARSSVVKAERQGHAVQLRHPPSPGARLHAALRDRRRRAGRRPAHDDQHRRTARRRPRRWCSTCRSRSTFEKQTDEITLPFFKPPAQVTRGDP